MCRSVSCFSVVIVTGVCTTNDSTGFYIAWTFFFANYGGTNVVFCIVRSIPLFLTVDGFAMTDVGIKLTTGFVET
jgi:hypothetical protein